MQHVEIAKGKINLNLRILGKRADGYHALKTRMAPVSLVDKLILTPASSYQLDCETEGVPLDETNLISMAVRIFQRETGKACDWHVRLEKNIPHGAGLGGGSSDAAAMLRALNFLEGTQLPLLDLADMAAEIGSDVPFFIYESVCDCEGRGEIISPVEWDEALHALLLKPSFGVSTPTAYKAWGDSHEIPGVCYASQPFSWGEMFNDLERPVFQKHRFLAEMKMWLLAQPECGGALMSGSGSTMIAFCPPDEAEALTSRAKVELDGTLWAAAVQVG